MPFWAKKGALDASFLTNRKFVEGVIWIGKNGGRWRCLPEEYGKWGGASTSVSSADQTRGIWQMIFNTLVEDADMEWVMIDATIIRAHQHSFGAKGG